MKVSGKLWVAGILALGAALGLFAVAYWRRPESRVRWSFTQIHTSLVRKRPEVAAQFIADRTTLDGKELSREEFLAAYRLASEADRLTVKPCAAAAEHWEVGLRGRAFCFLLEGKLWKLHWVGPAPCACR